MKLTKFIPRPGGAHASDQGAVYEILARLGDGSLTQVTIANDSPLIRLTARSPHTHERPIGLGWTISESCRELLINLEAAIRQAPTRAPCGRPLLRVLPGGLTAGGHGVLPTAPIAG